jgi:hypothetical protein
VPVISHYEKLGLARRIPAHDGIEQVYGRIRAVVEPLIQQEVGQQDGIVLAGSPFTATSDPW